MKILKFFICIFLVSSSHSFGFIAIESFTGISLGKVNHTNFSSSPTVINYSEDLSLVYGFGPLDIGVGGAFRYVGQLSEVLASVGNYKGSRWEIFPIIGLGFIDYSIHIEPIFIGKYSLSKVTTSFKSPSGARVFLTKSLGKLLFFANGGLSLMLDYVSFKKQDDAELTNKLKIWSVGLAIHIRIL